MIRKAKAVWRGTGRDGTGNLQVGPTAALGPRVTASAGYLRSCHETQPGSNLEWSSVNVPYAPGGRPCDGPVHDLWAWERPGPWSRRATG